jgi:hypothetical protein
MCGAARAEESTVVWIAPEAQDAQIRPPQCIKAALAEMPKECYKLVFWRIHMDSARGDWHLLVDEDRRFLKETAERIANGQYKSTKIEWTSLDGKLPK